MKGAAAITSLRRKLVSHLMHLETWLAAFHEQVALRRTLPSPVPKEIRPCFQEKSEQQSSNHNNNRNNNSNHNNNNSTTNSNHNNSSTTNSNHNNNNSTNNSNHNNPIVQGRTVACELAKRTVRILG